MPNDKPSCGASGVTSVTSSQEGRNMKLMCVHGYRQSGDIFRQKTGALRKLLKGHADFIYVTAPNKLVKEADGAEDGESVDQYGWWFSNYNNTFESKKYSEVCLGFEKSLSVIEDTWKTQGPFDGLLGFSQGATFVSILCSMQETGVLQLGFKFAIMIAGFKSRCLPHIKYYTNERINIPTLHIFGDSDQVIPQEMSEELTVFFEDPVIVTHPGGHYVPASKEQKCAYVNFLTAVAEIEESSTVENIGSEETSGGENTSASENGDGCQ